MHICLVSNTSWSFIKFRKNLIQAFVNSGYRVSIVAPEDEYTSEIKNLKVDFIPLSILDAKGKNPLKDFRLISYFQKMYLDIKPDIIFQYTIKPNIYSTIAASRCKIPVVAIITGLGYTFINQGLVPFIAKKMYKFALAKATKVWFLNQDDKLLFEKLKLIDSSKTEILNGEGIDTNYFAPMPIEKSDKTKFLLIARLLYDKGVREFYEAAKTVQVLYPDTQFDFLGYLNVDNPMAVDQNQMDEWVQSGAVNYLGSAKDVRPIIGSHHCVVLPSYREGLSVTLMEAGSMAKPLIVSNIAGCKELVEDQVNGYLCNAKDANDLALKMEKFLLLSLAEKKEMGRQSRIKMLNEFGFDSIYPTYLHAINTLVKK